MHFIINSAEVHANCLKAVGEISPNGKVQVEIKPYKKNRSTAQNRTMWMWLNVIAESIDWDAEELHEELKARFLGFNQVYRHGKECLIPKSTTKLSTAQMAEHLNKIEEFAKLMNVRLPIPQEYEYIMMKDNNNDSMCSSSNEGKLR